MIFWKKDWLWKLKMSSFWQVKQLFEGVLLDAKLLKFSCLTMKFHNRHYTIVFTYHFCCNKKLQNNPVLWHNFHPRFFLSNSVHLGPIDSHLHRYNHHVQCNWYQIGFFHWNLHILWCLHLHNFQLWLQHLGLLFQMSMVLENWKHNILLI